MDIELWCKTRGFDLEFKQIEELTEKLIVFYEKRASVSTAGTDDRFLLFDRNIEFECSIGIFGESFEIDNIKRPELPNIPFTVCSNQYNDDGTKAQLKFNSNVNKEIITSLINWLDSNLLSNNIQVYNSIFDKLEEPRTEISSSVNWSANRNRIEYNYYMEPVRTTSTQWKSVTKTPFFTTSDTLSREKRESEISKCNIHINPQLYKKVGIFDVRYRLFNENTVSLVCKETEKTNALYYVSYIATWLKTHVMSQNTNSKATDLLNPYKNHHFKIQTKEDDELEESSEVAYSTPSPFMSPPASASTILFERTKGHKKLCTTLFMTEYLIHKKYYIGCFIIDIKLIMEWKNINTIDRNILTCTTKSIHDSSSLLLREKLKSNFNSAYGRIEVEFNSKMIQQNKPYTFFMQLQFRKMIAEMNYLIYTLNKICSNLIESKYIKEPVDIGQKIE
jgi:hypothetical protein